ncbi:pilus assembly protein N-terminal domain-containing protein [Myxococcus sp. MISCRS1]|jgi:pilus assembly protein CpaC|uniref:type II and III secretion system protein family protein n=1 Tax=Myxococcus TaxID=32 RepID=UPI001143BF0D|nr:MULTISPECIES: pilus assembly protein N-terminal domain-containing protein [Myxococcus]BDT34101.1 pilus assembly protein N-terminal domain-containing protein [Myxococcus sp. MH1]MBZ4402043.1 pilus assembly protein N-terminal domain-containing protein [Myxococcus sp. AS-1-15]MBZ4414037.1 pilus assembly protein N-terminal domain-containing protein [Myxococcus sp. XM-1-1-1]MCK8503897.1 pilus assembly protein N-terminal domain-containing protein [Myxococcus fulvus]MCY0995918.1 pilus assembly pro
MFTRFTHAAALGALVALVAGGSALAQEGTTFSLGVGAQKVLNIPGLSKVALGDPSIADVKTLGSGQLLVTGQAEGKTTLLIWKSTGQRTSYLINVRKQDPNDVIAEIKRLLGEIEGVSVRMVGDRIYLDGQAYTTQDADRIEQVVSLYPNVKSFVKIAPNAKKLVAQNLNAAFQKGGLKNVQANVVGATIFLEGSVESQQDLQKAELITKAIGEKVENLLVVGIKRMILSEVQFVEIRRNSRDRYGIRYPLDITGTASAAATVTQELFPGTFGQGGSNLGLTAGADFSIGFQGNDGYGRLLAQPKLVCASGEKAEFLAGGEVPIPLITNNQFSVEYKKYGVILNLRPTADRNGNIQTEIEAEASEIDTSVAVSFGGSSTIPGFRTRKVKTNVTVRHGETIVLSGVFSHDEQKSVSKIPGLGHIPIVGELFKSRGFDSTKRELVIFVTPRIVNPDSDKVRTIIEDVKSRYKQARSEVNFNIFD